MASRKNSDYDEVERRIRAAALLAGVDWDELAARINEANFRPTTLRKLNQSSPATKVRSVFRRTAEATGLPVAFFTAPLSDLGPSQLETDDDLQATVRRLEDQMRETQAQIAVLEAEVHRQTAASSKTSGNPQREQLL